MDSRVLRFVHMRLMLPLVVPIVILAIGIFFVFAKLKATVTGLVLANVMLGLPYVATSVVAGLQGFDMMQEMVARSFSMNHFRAFMAVSLPLSTQDTGHHAFGSLAFG